MIHAVAYELDHSVHILYEAEEYSVFKTCMQSRHH